MNEYYAKRTHLWLHEGEDSTYDICLNCGNTYLVNPATEQVINAPLTCERWLIEAKVLLPIFQFAWDHEVPVRAVIAGWPDRHSQEMKSR